jgi:hypothetical protein
MVVGFTTTYAIKAYHRNNVSSSFTHGEVYSIQHYVIKFSVACDMSVVFYEYPGFFHQ